MSLLREIPSISTRPAQAVGDERVGGHAAAAATLQHLFDPAIKLPLFLILGATALFFALRISGAPIEDLQTYLFPIFLLAFAFLFRALELRISRIGFLVLLAVWAVDALHVRGFLGQRGGLTNFARLENDPNGLIGRGAMLRINHIADTYDISKTAPLQRLFEGSDEAERWIEGRADTPALIAGSGESFIVFPAPSLGAALDRMLSRFRRATVEPTAELEQLTRSYGLEIESTVEVTIPGSNRPLLLISSPDRISVPGEPVEMNRHYLAWLSNGLVRLTEADTTPALRQLGLRKKEILPDLARLPAAIDSFTEASRIIGDWPTPTPVIAARFFLGSMFLIEAVDGQIEPAAAQAADEVFKSAAGFTRGQSANPVAAALWNNHAVARALFTSGEDDLREAKRWLLRAAAVNDKSGRPVRAAKAAMINLILLERASL